MLIKRFSGALMKGDRPVWFHIVWWTRLFQSSLCWGRSKSPSEGQRSVQQGCGENMLISASWETAACAVFKWGLIDSHERKSLLTNGHVWWWGKNQQDWQQWKGSRPLIWGSSASRWQRQHCVHLTELVIKLVIFMEKKIWNPFSITLSLSI